MEVKNIEKCRICGNSDLISILDLGVQALSGRFPSEDEPDPPKATLELVKCNNTENPNACGLLQVKHSVPSQEMHLHNYGYKSGVNQTMRIGKKLVEELIDKAWELQYKKIRLRVQPDNKIAYELYKKTGFKKIGKSGEGLIWMEYGDKNVREI